MCTGPTVASRSSASRSPVDSRAYGRIRRPATRTADAFGDSCVYGPAPTTCRTTCFTTVDSHVCGPDDTAGLPLLLRIRRFPHVRAGRCRRAKPVRSGPSIPAGNTEAAEVGVGFLIGQQVPAIPVRTGRTSPQAWPRPPASVDSRAQGDDSRLSKGQPFRPSIPAAQGGQLGDDLERGVTPSIPARTGWRCAVGRACERPSRAHESRPCAAIEFGAGRPEIPVHGRTFVAWECLTTLLTVDLIGAANGHIEGEGAEAAARMRARCAMARWSASVALRPTLVSAPCRVPTGNISERGP